MILPNQITIARIFLIPVFIQLAICYGKTVGSGYPHEKLRWATIGVFLIASISDGIDGWIARRYYLKSQLGAILDPIADKGLMLAGIITLSLTHWPYAIPIWYPVLVIVRDFMIVLGCLVLRLLNKKMEIRPSFFGKISTFFQMGTIALVLLQWEHCEIMFWISGMITLVSGYGYIAKGIKQVHDGVDIQ